MVFYARSAVVVISGQILSRMEEEKEDEKKEEVKERQEEG